MEYKRLDYDNKTIENHSEEDKHKIRKQLKVKSMKDLTNWCKEQIKKGLGY